MRLIRRNSAEVLGSRVMWLTNVSMNVTTEVIGPKNLAGIIVPWSAGVYSTDEKTLAEMAMRPM